MAAPTPRRSWRWPPASPHRPRRDISPAWSRPTCWRPAPRAAAWRRDPDLRFCRTCYDHLAGQVGMAVTDALTQHGHLEPKGPRDWKLTRSGELFCTRLGVDLAGARAAHSRHFARQCLDWSERRPHISGALGSAIADTFFKKGWA